METERERNGITRPVVRTVDGNFFLTPTVKAVETAEKKSKEAWMIRQSRHIQPAPCTVYLLFLTQFVVRVCVEAFFGEMDEFRLFFGLLYLGIVSTTLVPPWSLHVASPAKSPSSSPETMHKLSMFCFVNPFRQVFHSSSRPKSHF